MIYTDDLLKAGYTGEEIRFFLIYGYYRTRLDFSYDRFKNTVLKLRHAYEMIEAIRNADAKESDEKVRELSERLKPDFEKNMDNDLHTRQAFDGLLRTLSQLAGLAEKNRISSGDAKRIIITLGSIDSVLQVLKLNDESFPHKVH